MPTPTQNSRLLRKPEVLSRLGIPKSSFDRGVRQGRFPKPVKIGQRSVAWTSNSIDSLIQRLSSTAE
jgi:prophage regulatory protein